MLCLPLPRLTLSNEYLINVPPKAIWCDRLVPKMILVMKSPLSTLIDKKIYQLNDHRIISKSYVPPFNLIFSILCQYGSSFQYVLRHGVSYVTPGAPNQPNVFNILSIWKLFPNIYLLRHSVSYVTPPLP